MNGRSSRRVAADIANLRAHGLPPCYFFAPNECFNGQAGKGLTKDNDNVRFIQVYLAGPDGSAYASGVFHVRIDFPKNYPKEPPVVKFNTRIWHPNINEATGQVCVNTLKQNWRSHLALRHVLITISGLLIRPNAENALNGEAGAMLIEDYASFVRRASMMCEMYAVVQEEWCELVRDAKCRVNNINEKCWGVGNGGDSSSSAYHYHCCTVSRKETGMNNLVPCGCQSGNWSIVGVKLGNSSILPYHPIQREVNGQDNIGSGTVTARARIDYAKWLERDTGSIMEEGLKSSSRPAGWELQEFADENLHAYDWKRGLEIDNDDEGLPGKVFEETLLRMAGYAISDYNRGIFGPLRGIRRL